MDPEGRKGPMTQKEDDMVEEVFQRRWARRRALGLVGASAVAASCAAQRPDPEVCELLVAASAKLGVEREPSANPVAKGLMLENGLSSNALSINELVLNGFSVNGSSTEVVEFNGLQVNGLELNGPQLSGFGSNGLGVNGLGVNGLGINGLGINGLDFSGKRVDPVALELLRYVARCALGADQYLAVRADGTSERLAGALGLAPEWPVRLSGEDERWVTACLLAHVNAFGEPVPISLRAGRRIAADATERDAFPIHEGAFFGSLSSAQRFSCSAVAPVTALALSRDRALRVCTDPGSSCSIEPVGACDEMCGAYDEEQGYSRCRGGGAVHDAVVNVYLRDDALLADCAVTAE